MLSLTRALAARQDKIRDNDKGFTLIELLVVVIIIGILAAIAIPIFLGQQNGAKDSAVKSDLANAKIAVIAYQVDNPSTSSVALDATTLGEYGFTVSEFTAFTTTTVNPTAAFVIGATSDTTNKFSISSSAGVVAVP